MRRNVAVHLVLSIKALTLMDTPRIRVNQVAAMMDVCV
ncbi:hypothetical protein BFV94_4267 [Alteromonas macleodii]|uniref:Transcriptional regulator n=1 Tax=Alteromonas macleodii TaxID=28108 RepID=A0AB36FLG4_ALTMA|nr:hypothetical protein BFV93_4580 [Alteromonas macleodii]OES25248.1 hypothetical protein BFV95_4459 [Alteromonas macleodii]OES25921.1 hypothetical protein BFV94_4267 [Alteromonas macleodii]OES38749.1 hypothetical protein BFV96_4679 [Alteromonas macleodii]